MIQFTMFAVETHVFDKHTEEGPLWNSAGIWFVAASNEEQAQAMALRYSHRFYKEKKNTLSAGRPVSMWDIGSNDPMLRREDYDRMRKAYRAAQENA